MKKFVFALLILLAATFSYADDTTLNLIFTWDQDTTNLDHWTLYQSDVAGGPYTKVIDIPWNGQTTEHYTATNSFTVTGNPGDTVTKYFMVTASSTTEESGPSNEVSQEFLIPAHISAPFSLTITVEVQ